MIGVFTQNTFVCKLGQFWEFTLVFELDCSYIEMRTRREPVCFIFLVLTSNDYDDDAKHMGGMSFRSAMMMPISSRTQTDSGHQHPH